MKKRLIGCCFALLLVAAPASAAGDDVPAWLRQAASASSPTYAKDVPAVVLLNEQQVTVGADGRVTTVTNYAVRILTREGRGSAFAAMPYKTDTEKVREMRAWLIRPSGQIKSYGKDRVLDAAAAPNDIYNEVRVKMIMAEDDAEAGAVFGYQVTSEDRSIFTQFDWSFQHRLPVLMSRVTLTLPTDWRASGVTFNHAKIDPAITGSTYSWELRDLPYIEEEPFSPPVTSLAPRLAVSYFPAPGAQVTPGKTFENWADVSRWMSELEDPQATLSDPLAAKAQELTAGAKNELERIQAIGRYVQNIQYISIQTGIGRGGGYRPHAATEVFAKSYGDCKDKANLMRAMLKALHIQSYLVSIYSGDPTYVRAEWASPQQFNHCIIAIKVGDETQASTIVKHPSLGRLLIFDPTDENTPVGDLPSYEQSSLALIDAKDSSELLRMPVTPPEANQLERQAEVQLASDGSITASVRERAAGQAAVAFRREFRRFSRPEFTKRIERWVTSGANGASVSKVEPLDSSADGRFALDVEFSARNYAQLMQQRLLVFKPAIVARRESLLFTGGSRKHPVVLESNAYTETVRVKLPTGFEVDEMPDPLKLDAPFGTYATSYAVKDGNLVFTRTLVMRATTIPAEQYNTVRSFFERIRAAEQTPVVLARK